MGNFFQSQITPETVALAEQALFEMVAVVHAHSPAGISSEDQSLENEYRALVKKDKEKLGENDERRFLKLMGYMAGLNKAVLFSGLKIDDTKTEEHHLPARPNLNQFVSVVDLLADPNASDRNLTYRLRDMMFPYHCDGLAPLRRNHLIEHEKMSIIQTNIFLNFYAFYHQQTRADMESCNAASIFYSAANTSRSIYEKHPGVHVWLAPHLLKARSETGRSEYYDSSRDSNSLEAGMHRNRQSRGDIKDGIVAIAAVYASKCLSKLAELCPKGIGGHGASLTRQALAPSIPLADSPTQQPPGQDGRKK